MEQQQMFFVFLGAEDGEGSGKLPRKRRKASHPMMTRSRTKEIPNPEAHNYSAAEWEYFTQCSTDVRNEIAEAEALVSRNGHDDVPLRFRLLLSGGVPDAVKAIAMRKCSALATMHAGSGEYSKSAAWLDALCGIPFGRYVPVPTTDERAVSRVLTEVADVLDARVYGHSEVKREIVNYVAQKLVNPLSAGKVLCLAGAPGIAKTHLVRAGISQAMRLPFSMIALGGANDGAFLDGHGFTYEGSRPGIIVQELVRLECLNPVIFFDELDKVSSDARGQEVINILLHVTDPSQNDAFRDKYFADVPVDLSKAFLVFSCNDVTRVNSILRDRLTVLNMKGYTLADKVKIAQRHLLADICADFCLSRDDVRVDDGVLEYIVGLIAKEDGVRALKRALHCIVSSMNTQRLLGGITDPPPYAITRPAVDKYLGDSYKTDSAASMGLGMMYV